MEKYHGLTADQVARMVPDAPTVHYRGFEIQNYAKTQMSHVVVDGCHVAWLDHYNDIEQGKQIIDDIQRQIAAIEVV